MLSCMFQRIASASGQQVDSPHRTQVTVENPSLQRYTGSPTSQSNGCRNGTHDEADARLKPSPSKHQAEHLSTGLASRAAKGSSSSIPYIDCSDIDSEYDLVKGRITVSRSRAHDSDEVEPVARRNVNGNGQENGHGAGKFMSRDSPLSSRRLARSSDAFNGSQSSNGSFCANGSPRAFPLSSTLVDEMFQVDRRGPKSPTGRVLSSRSANCSPVLSGFHKTSSLNYSEQMGYSGRHRWDDGGRYLSNGRSGGDGQHYGSYSPIVNRSPLLQKLQNGLRNRSDTDPMILSHLDSTPANEARPAASRAERIAALERRVASSQARSNMTQQVYGSRLSANDHNSPVHMIDGSTSSGTESSDTESDAGSNSYSQPLVYGNPGAAGSSPVPRNTFSFPLEDEGRGGEDGYLYPISNEDGAQLFNC